MNVLILIIIVFYLFILQYFEDSTQYIKNLYFLYSIITKSILKLKPILKSMTFYTGNTTHDSATKAIVMNILNNLDYSPGIFIENNMFSNNPNETIFIKVLLLLYFTHTRIN